MCGIAGIFAHRPGAPCVNEPELLRMRESMVKRGPDGAGNWISGDRRVGLAHRRLSIIDLSEAGAQPMASADGSLVITFNGEIYNYKELRARLEREGRKFRSHSDTEVLLHLYELQGTEMVHALRGMFAFAIWDSKKKGVFMARDTYGIKPLYFSNESGVFRFASQVKSIIAGGGLTAAPSMAGRAGFFLLGYVPEPFTLYKNIRALPAGHTLWMGGDGLCSIKPYREVHQIYREAKPDGISGTDKRKILHDALLDSVKQHLVADVPVGIFLSAGMDSGTLAALASELPGAKLESITLGFDAGNLDETTQASETADRYGLKHRNIRVGIEDFKGASEQMISAMDQPSVDGVNSWFVSRAAAQSGLKVALSGLGGDELFGGYPSFRDVPRISRGLKWTKYVPGFRTLARLVTEPILSRMTSPKYAGLLEYGNSDGGAYLLRRGLFMPWELAGVMGADEARAGWRELQLLLRLDATTTSMHSWRGKVSALESSWYMRGQLLRDADWAGMAHSLEVRVPLVDCTLLERLAPMMVSDNPPTKEEMALTPENPLSAELLGRPKTGFSVPIRDWLIESTGIKERGLRGWARHLMEGFSA